MASTGKNLPSDVSQDPWATEAFVQDLVRTASLLRAVDEATQSLVLAGHVPALASTAGTEGLLAGVASRLEPGDWAFPGRRQSGIALARGASLGAWFGQALGRVSDPSRGRQSPGHFCQASLNVASFSSQPGSQLAHAVGLGRALRQQGRRAASVALCGHVATSSADFHVALNFAAVWRAPVVFVVGVGSGLERQTAAESVAIKARAYGLPALEVDGGDGLAVARAVEDALERARDGAGATLVAAACPEPPRTSPGLVSPGPRAVGADAEAWAESDPLSRLEARLVQQGLLDGADAQEGRRAARALVDAAVATALTLPAPPAATLFEGVFRERTPALTQGRREFLAAAHAPPGH